VSGTAAAAGRRRAEVVHGVDDRLGRALEALRCLLGRLVGHGLGRAVPLLGPLAEAAALLLDGELRERGDRLDDAARRVLQELTELVDVDLARVVGVVPLEELLDRRVARALRDGLLGQVGEVPIGRLVSARLGQRRRHLGFILGPQLAKG